MLVCRCLFVLGCTMLIAYSDRLLYLVFRMKCTNKCDLYAWHANLTSLLHFKRFGICNVFVLCRLLHFMSVFAIQHERNLT